MIFSILKEVEKFSWSLSRDYDESIKVKYIKDSKKRDYTSFFTGYLSSGKKVDVYNLTWFIVG